MIREFVGVTALPLYASVPLVRLASPRLRQRLRCWSDERLIGGAKSDRCYEVGLAFGSYEVCHSNRLRDSFRIDNPIPAKFRVPRDSRR